MFLSLPALFPHLPTSGDSLYPNYLCWKSNPQERENTCILPGKGRVPRPRGHWCFLQTSKDSKTHGKAKHSTAADSENETDHRRCWQGCSGRWSLKLVFDASSQASERSPQLCGKAGFSIETGPHGQWSPSTPCQHGK